MCDHDIIWHFLKFDSKGIDTDEPVLQIGNYTFLGEFKGRKIFVFVLA